MIIADFVQLILVAPNVENQKTMISPINYCPPEGSTFLFKQFHILYFFSNF